MFFHVDKWKLYFKIWSTQDEFWVNGQVKNSEIVDENKERLFFPTTNKNFIKNSCIAVRKLFFNNFYDFSKSLSIYVSKLLKIIT